jgi:DNA-directed RNA polymerase specialized sigma subunit
MEIDMSEPPLLSERASDAISRFAKLAERAQLETRGDKRVDVANRYAAARLALEPRERAILDMMALKRRTLADLAARTGQSVDSLAQLLSAAGERLADHFEKRGSDRSEGV